jgi:hypothetical protein
MSNPKTGQLSESELREMHEAQREVGQAQRRIAALLAKHLAVKSSEDLQLRDPIYGPGAVIDEQKKTLQVIYEGCCKPVGLYVDPPGICVPI